MVVQAEGFVKASIALIPDVPSHYMVYNIRRSTDVLLCSSIMHLASFLLYFPGHPQHGPFYLALGVLNSILKFEPWAGPNPYKQQVFLGFLRLFAAYSQKKFPLTIPHVDSNNSLYGGSEEYQGQLAPFLTKLVDLIVADIEAIGNGDVVSRKNQGTLALDLINTMASTIVMDRHAATLVYKLFQVVREDLDAIDKKYWNSTYDRILARKGKMYRELCKKLRSDGGFDHKETQSS
jgi:hypothetical protein